MFGFFLNNQYILLENFHAYPNAFEKCGKIQNI